MICKNTTIKGLKIIQIDCHEDNRGCFYEFYNKKYDSLINGTRFAQINFSKSKKNVFRGMHLLKDEQQYKLIKCINGKVLDIVIDCRKGSSTYKKCFKIELSASCNYELLIPPGCAHGFLSYENDSIICFMVNVSSCGKQEIGFNIFDSSIFRNFSTENSLILSKKDSLLPAYDVVEGMF